MKQCYCFKNLSQRGIKKLRDDDIIKKDDKIVGVLSGRQKEPMLPIEYHNDPNNRFAIPPKS